MTTTIDLPTLHFLDDKGMPIYNIDESISSGTISYRYFSLLTLLNIFNKSGPLVCSPISSNPDTSFLNWNVSKEILKYNEDFVIKLKECFTSKARFIIITLRLIRLEIQHANYILIDRGFNFEKIQNITAIRIEPMGFCNTCETYKPTQLDTKIKEFFHEVLGGEILVTLLNEEALISKIGPQSIEIQERLFCKRDQIFYNKGLCASHSLAIVYSLFENIIKKKIDISIIEGEKLFEALFGLITFDFLYSGGNEWVEQYVVALNQAITKENELMYLQLGEIHSIGKPITRRGTRSDLLIPTLLEMGRIKASYAGREDDGSTDKVIINNYNYIMKHSSIDQKHKDEIFTIYGINIEKLMQLYSELVSIPPPLSPPSSHRPPSHRPPSHRPPSHRSPSRQSLATRRKKGRNRPYKGGNIKTKKKHKKYKKLKKSKKLKKIKKFRK